MKSPLQSLTVLLSISSIATGFAFFTTSPISRKTRFSTNTKPISSLYAQGEAPQYVKHDGRLTEVEHLADGTVMLHIQANYTHPNQEMSYMPGHVLALEIEYKSDDDTVPPLNEKNRKDVENNDGWIRGPYTISRSYNSNVTESSFQIMLRTVGDKSTFFSKAKPNTPVRFGGKFKVPILEGIDCSTTKRIVLLSTGVGVGPCIGAIEDYFSTINEHDDKSIKVELYASFRREEDVVYSDHLNHLSKTIPNQQFLCKEIITSQTGRLSSSPENMNLLQTQSDSLEDTHYHLIGNGQMVNEWKAGLERAGVPENKVTLEIYFNHRESADEDIVNTIANSIKGTVVAAAK